jgi:hypothetical protein
MQLSADDQRDLRDAAADAWKQSGGKYLRSATLFKRDPRVVKFDALTIITLLMYAYELWKWWNKYKISDPSDFRTNAIMLLGDEPKFGATDLGFGDE